MNVRHLTHALPFVLCCSGCVAFLPAPTPMTALRDELPGGDAKCLVVFLPGYGDTGSDFTKYGFIEALRARGLSVDVVSANATVGYYARSQLVERLHTDVVAPARARGAQQTWVMGMSMGGMGTLLYAHDHAADVTGVLVLAPWLGDRALIEEIGAAGGLAAWKAPEKTPLTPERYQREVWRWLKAVTSNQEPGPTVYLGWGTEDLLGKEAALLAAALPEKNVFKVPGGHKWTSWKALLEGFLIDSDFSRSCAP